MRNDSNKVLNICYLKPFNKSMLKLRIILYVVILLLCSCKSTHKVNMWTYAPYQRDSIIFATTHHYSINSNFIITSDSLTLISDIPQFNTIVSDTLRLAKGIDIVVAGINYQHTDSLDSDSTWIYVISKNNVRGWVCEKELLTNTSPDDPISQFIHLFSNKNVYIFFLLIGFIIFVFIFRELYQHNNGKSKQLLKLFQTDTPYPMLFTIVVSITATVYATIQNFYTDQWIEYYFSPSLNPLGQYPIIGLFIIMTWASVIYLVAAIDEIRRKLFFIDALTYFAIMLCISFALYIFFTLTCKIYIGYPALLLYCFISVKIYHNFNGIFLRCGNCHKIIKTLGKCPHCGAINK